MHVAGTVGLRNRGNSCFMNAGLQCLSHIEPLAEFFLSRQYEADLNETNPLGCKGRLARLFAELQKALWQSEQKVFDPGALHTALRKFAPHLFEGGEQQDVQEFLAFYLDGLHEDLNRVRVQPPPTTEEQEVEDSRLGEERGDEFAAALAWLRHLERGKSFLVDLLQGQMRSSLTCSRCGHVARRFEPFLYLSLPVAKGMTSVTDCLSKYLEAEVLSGDEQWNCPKCNAAVDASKKIDLWKLPPVLVLHLKRFAFDAAQMRFEKTENRLSMRLSLLDLTKFCSSEQREGAVYNVACVANHLGSFESGHYTATCRVGGVRAGTWQHFDDGRVKVLDGGRSVITRETYVIFLVRHVPPQDKTTWLRACASAADRRLLRRQSESLPENWPHPSSSAMAVLDELGRGQRRERPQADCPPPTDDASTAIGAVATATTATVDAATAVAAVAADGDHRVTADIAPLLGSGKGATASGFVDTDAGNAATSQGTATLDVTRGPGVRQEATTSGAGVADVSTCQTSATQDATAGQAAATTVVAARPRAGLRSAAAGRSREHVHAAASLAYAAEEAPPPFKKQRTLDELWSRPRGK